jgi:hypothetical protein
VVLGGASIFGGRGPVLGTVLGVLLIQVIDNSLTLAGVPSAWQRTAVGIPWPRQHPNDMFSARPGRGTGAAPA